jgi:hypothetical protein
VGALRDYNMRTDASHHIREDAFETGRRQFAQPVIQKDDVPGAQPAGDQGPLVRSPLAGGGTNQGYLGAGRGIPCERTSAKVAGLVWIRGETQETKGHTG